MWTVLGLRKICFHNFLNHYLSMAVPGFWKDRIGWSIGGYT